MCVGDDLVVWQGWPCWLVSALALGLPLVDVFIVYPTAFSWVIYCHRVEYGEFSPMRMRFGELSGVGSCP